MCDGTRNTHWLCSICSRSPNTDCVYWEQICPFTILNRRRNDPNSEEHLETSEAQNVPGTCGTQQNLETTNFFVGFLWIPLCTLFTFPMLANPMDEKESIWSKEIIKNILPHPASYPPITQMSLGFLPWDTCICSYLCLLSVSAKRNTV